MELPAALRLPTQLLRVAQSVLVESRKLAWLRRQTLPPGMAWVPAPRELQSSGMLPVLWAGLPPQARPLKDVAQEERLREPVASGWHSEHRQDEKFGKDRSWS
jgi:hypothetical protein